MNIASVIISAALLATLSGCAGWDQRMNESYQKEGAKRCAKQGLANGSAVYNDCVAQFVQTRIDQRSAVRGDLLAGTAVAATVGANVWSAEQQGRARAYGQPLQDQPLQWRTCPDGRYVLTNACYLAPDGTYVGGPPQQAPDGRYIGRTSGNVIMCPDGRYVTGSRCQLAPDGSYVGID
jgi:hypothetical protein